MQPEFDPAAGKTATSMVFADGARRVVLVLDRALTRDRLAARILGQAAAQARDAAALEIRVAQVAESLGWFVRAERGLAASVLLTVGVA